MKAAAVLSPSRATTVRAPDEARASASDDGNGFARELEHTSRPSRDKPSTDKAPADKAASPQSGKHDRPDDSSPAAAGLPPGEGVPPPLDKRAPQKAASPNPTPTIKARVGNSQRLPHGGKHLPVKGDAAADADKMSAPGARGNGRFDLLAGLRIKGADGDSTAGRATGAKRGPLAGSGILNQPLASSTGPDATAANAAFLPQLNSAGNAPNGPAPQMPALDQPLNSNAFKQQFSGQVTWLVRHDVKSAKLKMNPPNLGSIQVNIQHSQNQTQVWLHADNPATRSAMQNSLPQLQQLFDQQGLSLQGAHVSTQSFADSGGNPPFAHGNASADAGDAFADPDAGDGGDVMRTPLIEAGLVDLFA